MQELMQVSCWLHGLYKHCLASWSAQGLAAPHTDRGHRTLRLALKRLLAWMDGTPSIGPFEHVNMWVGRVTYLLQRTMFFKMFTGEHARSVVLCMSVLLPIPLRPQRVCSAAALTHFCRHETRVPRLVKHPSLAYKPSCVTKAMLARWVRHSGPHLDHFRPFSASAASLDLWSRAVNT